MSVFPPLGALMAIRRGETFVRIFFVDSEILSRSFGPIGVRFDSFKAVVAPITKQPSDLSGDVAMIYMETATARRFSLRAQRAMSTLFQKFRVIPFLRQSVKALQLMLAIARQVFFRILFRVTPAPLLLRRIFLAGRLRMSSQRCDDCRSGLFWMLLVIGLRNALRALFAIPCECWFALSVCNDVEV